VRISSSAAAPSIWSRAEGGDSREGGHAHGLEHAKEWTPAASVVVGCSTPVCASRQGARTLAMDPAEEGAGVGEEERRGNGGGGGGGVGGASRRCTW
jgi:hypothetical protein